MAQLVTNQLAADHQPKEVIRLTPKVVVAFDQTRCNYTWNVLISLACRWAGLAPYPAQYAVPGAPGSAGSLVSAGLCHLG